jgi:peptidoglycan-N-acetylglucosamine deacetylase
VRKILLKKIVSIFLVAFLLICLFGVTTYKIMNSRKFQFFGGFVSRIDTKDKVVALTFDDGPSQKVGDILSILNSQNVKATFFLIGNEIKQYPEETKKLISSLLSKAV